jgi:hypothetical protein
MPTIYREGGAIDEMTQEWNRHFQSPPKRPMPTKQLTESEIISGSKEVSDSVIRDKSLGERKIIAVPSRHKIVDFGVKGCFNVDLPPY